MIKTITKRQQAHLPAPTPHLMLVSSSASRPAHGAGIALLFADILAMIVAFAVGGVAAWAANIYLLDDSFQELLNKTSATQFVLFATLGCTGLLWLDQQGHYRQRLPFWEVAGHIVTLALVGLLVGGFIQYALKNEFSRLWLGLSWVSFAALLFVGRNITRQILQARGRWIVPVLLLGSGPTARRITHALQDDKTMGYDIAGQLDAAELAGITQSADWHRLLASKQASHVLIALEGAELQAQQAALQALARGRVPFSIVPPWAGLPVAGATPHSFFTHDAMLLHNTNRLTLPLPRLLKRSFDIAVSLPLLIVLAVPFALLACFIARDGGSVFFVQPRLGLHGRAFGCYKFRSMVVDAPQALASYLASNVQAAAEWQQYQKLQHDPRVTRLGAFMRRTSIDELPQLLNVLLGHMSLVGPRPIMPAQRSLYGDDFAYYTAVRPGITGPWQVSGRSTLGFDERVQLETWYGRNWTLWMDIVLLLKTPRAVLSTKQAA